jgi:DNA-binding XRE family transcriptional regulator
MFCQKALHFQINLVCQRLRQSVGGIAMSCLQKMSVLCTRENSMITGKELKDFRKSLKLTQLALAKRLGVARQTVSNAERRPEDHVSFQVQYGFDQYRAKLKLVEPVNPIEQSDQKPKRKKA